MPNRSAIPVIFGFDFQVNAAIVLMLEHICELDALKLESDNEDIDLILKSGAHILAQAKSVEHSSSDFKHVRQNLKKSLISLAEGAKKVIGSRATVDKLIFITNSPNPFNDTRTSNVFYGHAHRDFETLPQSCKSLISEYINEQTEPLETDKLMIQVIPFETENILERYKVVMQTVNDFVGTLNISEPGLGKKLHTVWCRDIFQNGSKHNISLSKEQIIWPIIVLITDIDKAGSDFDIYVDTSIDYDEIVRKYHGLIDTCCERTEYFTKVLYDYNGFHFMGSQRDKAKTFIMNNWHDYAEEFMDSIQDEELVEGLTKVILFSILKRRKDISHIKEEVCL